MKPITLFGNLAFVFFTLLFILCLTEFISQIVYRLLKGRYFRLNTFYPFRPTHYFKVAIFGGSTAAGYFADVSFSTILSFELKKVISNKKVYIENFAESGATFSGHQAELAKRLVHFFDLIIIYAGNNESLPYLDDVNYFDNKDTLKDFYLKSLKKLQLKYESSYKFFMVIPYRSIVYNVYLKHVYEKTLGKIIQRLVKTEPPHLEKLPVISDSPIISPMARHEIQKNYRRDLNVLKELVNAHDKKMILCGVATNEMCPPPLSVFSDKLSTQAKENIFTLLTSAQQCVDENKSGTALEKLHEAIDLDPNVAILNYELGCLYIKKKSFQKAWQYFSKAIDCCGFQIRASTTLNSILKEISVDEPNICFIDTVQTFHTYTETGGNYLDLFMDHVHPTGLGHCIISNRILVAISSLFNAKDGVITKVTGYQDFNHLYEYYKNLFSNRKLESEILYHCAGWFLRLYSWSGDSGEYVNIAEVKLRAWWALTEKTESDKMKFKFMMSLILLVRGDYKLAYKLLRRLKHEDEAAFMYHINAAESPVWLRKRSFRVLLKEKMKRADFDTLLSKSTSLQRGL